MQVGHSQHTSLTSQLNSLIEEVGQLKTQVGMGADGQALAVLHTDLRKCLAWTNEISSVPDEVDKSQ